MAKSLRSRKKKRVKASKGKLLHSQQSWLNQREETKMNVLQSALEAPKVVPLLEKNTVLLMAKKAERDEAKAKIKAERKAAQSLESISLEEEHEHPTDADLSPEIRDGVLRLRSELATLRRQIGRRKGKPKGQMFQEERKSRVKQIVAQLKLMDKSDQQNVRKDAALPKKKKLSGKTNPLGIKSGGVMKRKGVGSETRPAALDGDDEMDVSDPEADRPEECSEAVKEDDANVFDGGVQLKQGKRKKQKTGGRLGSEWLRKKPDNKMKRYGTTRAAKGRKKFEFKGIYQFYPKPIPSKGE